MSTATGLRVQDYTLALCIAVALYHSVPDAGHTGWWVEDLDSELKRLGYTSRQRDRLVASCAADGERVVELEEVLAYQAASGLYGAHQVSLVESAGWRGLKAWVDAATAL